jgi:hypothetical protein
MSSPSEIIFLLLGLNISLLQLDINIYIKLKQSLKKQMVGPCVKFGRIDSWGHFINFLSAALALVDYSPSY